jgi:choline dehydrogenase-like flavoprotein
VSEHYDVIVVGGGSAGCVLAGRLSEDAHRTVMVLETGPDSPVDREAPSFGIEAQAPGRVYPDVFAERARNTVPRLYELGRGIGGSSVINAMVGMWGTPDDYDRWERDLGCRGWSWTDVAPVFARLPIPLTRARRAEWGSVSRALLEAAATAGHGTTEEYRLPDTDGAAPALLTRSLGKRVSAADAYLESARGRPNLAIRPDTRVARVLIDNRRAIGVETASGDVIEASEVVVAAGAIHSPALLLDSGVDRPAVGRGLKDHPSTTITLHLRERNDATTCALATVLRWSSSIGHADLQLSPLDHTGSPEYGALMAAAMVVHSEGTVERVEGRTVVRFDMLADDRDRLRLREALRHSARIAQTPPFAAVASGAFIDDIGTPLAAVPDDDVELDRWLANHVGDYVHASCSCRMGEPADEHAVVDTQGLVHGYSGLRVCDASIFPDLPRANPHLPVVMVAERIAAMIRSS